MPDLWTIAHSAWGQLVGREKPSKSLDGFKDALRTGRIRSALGPDNKPLPTIVLTRPGAIDRALGLCGADMAVEIDPLWPQEWQDLNGRGLRINVQDLGQWQCDRDAPLPPQTKAPAQLSRWSLRQEENVTLAEALSYMAFEFAMKGERLARAVRWESMGPMAEMQVKLGDTMKDIARAGREGRLTLNGKPMGNDGRLAKRELIGALALVDFQSADWANDRLYEGEGLARFLRPGEGGAAMLLPPSTGRYFAEVWVDRAQLASLKVPSGDAMSLDALKAWISGQPEKSWQTAWTDLGKAPGGRGACSKEAFRELWKQERGSRPVGRPRKKKPS